MTRGDGPIIGHPQAPVEIVLFSDFRCRFCRNANEVINGIKTNYGDQVRIIYKYLPLEFDVVTPFISESLLVAAEFDLLNSMQDGLFQISNELSPESVLDLAEELGLSRDMIERGLETERWRLVEQHHGEAQELNIQGVPTAFVNGRRLTSLSLSSLEEAITISLSL